MWPCGWDPELQGKSCYLPEGISVHGGRGILGSQESLSLQDSHKHISLKTVTGRLLHSSLQSYLYTHHKHITYFNTRVLITIVLILLKNIFNTIVLITILILPQLHQTALQSDQETLSVSSREYLPLQKNTTE